MSQPLARRFDTDTGVQVQGDSHGMQRAHSAQFSDMGDHPTLGHTRKLGSAEDVRSTDGRGGGRRLPESPAFAAAARYFSEPLNDTAVGPSALH